MVGVAAPPDTMGEPVEPWLAFAARPFDRLKARIIEATTTANNFNRLLRDNTRAVASHNFVFGFHPPLHTRIQQLGKWVRR